MGCVMGKENDKNATGLNFKQDHIDQLETFTAAEMISGGVTSRIELSISAQNLKGFEFIIAPHIPIKHHRHS